MPGTLVLATTERDGLARNTLELLTGGIRLKGKLAEPVGAAILGKEVGSHVQELFAYGADQVYRAEHPLLEHYQGDAYAIALHQVCQRARANVILLAGDSIGRELGPRLAHRLKAGFVADFVDFDLDAPSGKLLFTRQTYGGKAMAVMQARVGPVVATVKVRALDPATKAEGRTGEEIRVDVALDASQLRTRVLEKVQEEVTGVKLEDAKIVGCEIGQEPDGRM